MTIFSRLFGKRPAAVQAQEAPALVEAPMVDRALFIAEPIEPGMQDELEEASVLSGLMKRDYEDKGRKDGHEYYDLDRMKLQIELIATDFRRAYDKELEEVECQLGQLEAQLREDLQEMAPGLYRKLDTRFKELEKTKRGLQLQKDLAVLGEGYVESAVKYYKAGYLSGMKVRLEGDLLFKHVKIM